MGNNVTYDNAIFRYNTAVNGSALFVDGVASLKNYCILQKPGLYLCIAYYCSKSEKSLWSNC